ncbi:MAG TPA: hypothetical protein VJX92_15560, partial [Methylomirabilota bacterium]|nr:hypothetical protein [Methylomirabilota bacterium]
MSAWLRGNWKYLLAAVGVFAVVIVLYLRSRSSGGAASQISFPAPAAGADTGAGAAPAAPLATGTPGTYLAGTSGLTTWQGNTYRWFVTAPNQGIQDAAAFFAQQRDTSGQLSDELGRLTFFNGNATSDAAGNTFWTLPLGLPGYKEGDLPKWQRLIYAGGIPAGAGVGVGGPGAIANLSAAGLRAQAASHRA